MLKTRRHLGKISKITVCFLEKYAFPILSQGEIENHVRPIIIEKVSVKKSIHRKK